MDGTCPTGYTLVTWSQLWSRTEARDPRPGFEQVWGWLVSPCDSWENDHSSEGWCCTCLQMTMSYDYLFGLLWFSMPWPCTLWQDDFQALCIAMYGEPWVSPSTATHWCWTQWPILHVAILRCVLNWCWCPFAVSIFMLTPWNLFYHVDCTVCKQYSAMSKTDIMVPVHQGKFKVAGNITCGVVMLQNSQFNLPCLSDFAHCLVKQFQTFVVACVVVQAGSVYRRFLMRRHLYARRCRSTPFKVEQHFARCCWFVWGFALKKFAVQPVSLFGGGRWNRGPPKGVPHGAKCEFQAIATKKMMSGWTVWCFVLCMW